LPLSEEIKQYFEKSTNTQPQVLRFREELKKLRELLSRKARGTVILLL